LFNLFNKKHKITYNTCFAVLLALKCVTMQDLIAEKHASDS
jgi:hypothetical protein